MAWKMSIIGGDREEDNRTEAGHGIIGGKICVPILTRVAGIKGCGYKKQPPGLPVL